ncbi:MAG: hypothetical protein IKZ51_03195 [Bacteroidales bacterium]|nr:hypothetical protein [Bacteroidales bacterium]
MKYKILLIIGTVLLVCSCSLAYQSSSGSSSSGSSSAKTTTSSSVSTASSSGSGSGSLTSKSGYQPTRSDVSRYNDDIKAFLTANLPNAKIINDAAVIVDDKVVSDVSAVKLSAVKNISVLEKAPSLTIGDKSTHGAIVIRTK